ncbi:MAG TPA: MFS transporter [Burkholderiaceae bacterium]|nr:MFS transporter [Burkholderiaceae bacterium]
MTSRSSSRMSGQEVRASASLASIFALRMLGLFLILPVFSVHARSIPGGDNPALVGLALGIYGLTQGVLQIPFGAASDRWGRKPVIVAGLVLFAVGSFVAASADDIFWTIIGRAVQGAGAISAAVTAFIADATREEHRTKAMAMVGGSIGLTFAVSLVGAPPLYAAVGMGGLFALTGVLALIAIAVVTWVVPSAPARIQHDDPATASSVVFDPQLLRLNFGIFALHTVQMAMFVVVPVLLVERAQLPLPNHWWIYLPVVLVSFGLMMPPIIVAERKSRMRTLFLSAVGLLFVVQLGLMAYAPSLMWIAGWMLFFFVGFNILEASLPSLVSRVAPSSAKGLALGIYNTTQSVGLFAGGALGGAIAARWGAQGVFACAAVIMGVWWVIALGMREVPKRSSGQPVPV